MKEKLIFAVEVIAVVSLFSYFNSTIFRLPVIGSYLPGGEKF